MPSMVNCPQCSRQLRVPDNLLGQAVKCPSCGVQFTAEAPPLPVEEIADIQPVGPEAGNPNAPPAIPRPVSPPPYYEADEYGDYPRRRRRDYEPHRGSMILVFGILSLVICLTTPILGPMAWVMGNNDLAAIRAGRMDPEGEGMTNAGRICGMIASILFIVGLAFYCLIFALALGAGGMR